MIRTIELLYNLDIQFEAMCQILFYRDEYWSKQG